VRTKLDENLSGRQRRLLEDHGHDVETVADEGLSGAADHVVARRARQEARMLVTLDVEMGDITRNPPGSHSGVGVIRVSETRPSLVSAALSGLLARHRLDDLEGCVVIAQLGGIRIRRSAV
jgi:predicted nuclease of predicted toxin-antitoxin system